MSEQLQIPMEKNRRKRQNRYPQHKHDHTDTSMKSGGAKLAVWTQAPLLSEKKKKFSMA